MKKVAVITILAAAVCGVLLARLAFRNDLQDAGTERFAVVVPPISETPMELELAPSPRKPGGQTAQERWVENEKMFLELKQEIEESQKRLEKFDLPQTREERARLLERLGSYSKDRSQFFDVPGHPFDLVADSAREFDGELIEGKYGYIANHQTSIRKIISPNAATVLIRPVSRLNDPASDQEVLITGLSMVGYSEKSRINLYMPFKVGSKQTIGEKPLVRLEAVPLYPK